MNARDVLKYGHDFVLRNLAGLPQQHWAQANVCGWWSTKDILAHLTSFECVLVEVLKSYLGGGPTPTLDQFTSHAGNFNDTQVSLRQAKTPAEVFDEYQARHVETMALIAEIPLEMIRQPGTLPWYVQEYSLDDFIVYTYYGHKREHMAQVNVFKDSLK
jgi:hypothetical protein